MSHLAAREWSDGAAGPLLRLLMSATAAKDAGWMDLALCAEVDPEIFFPQSNDGHNPGADAKRVCMECRVRAQCLEYALARKERHGIWGGLSERQRRVIERRREREARAA